MVRIVINHDLVGVPHPAVAKAHIIGRHAPEKSPEPKTLRTAAAQAPNVAAANPAVETAVFPGMVEMIVIIAAPAVMTYPLTIVVNVRSFRVALAVCVVILLRRLFDFSMMGSRSMRWNVTAPDPVRAAATAMVLFATLRQREGCGRHSQSRDRENLKETTFARSEHLDRFASDC